VQRVLRKPLEVAPTFTVGSVSFTSGHVCLSYVVVLVVQSPPGASLPATCGLRTRTSHRVESSLTARACSVHILVQGVPVALANYLVGRGCCRSTACGARASTGVAGPRVPVWHPEGFSGSYRALRSRHHLVRQLPNFRWKYLLPNRNVSLFPRTALTEHV
jgi:hypothetical protein